MTVVDDYVSMFRPAWMAGAACRGTDPDLWILERGDPGTGRYLRETFCAICPVRGTCAQEAMKLEILRDLESGPMRAGLTGATWRRFKAAAKLLEVETDEEWEWLVDQFLDGLLVLRRGEAPRFVDEDVLA